MPIDTENGTEWGSVLLHHLYHIAIQYHFKINQHCAKDLASASQHQPMPFFPQHHSFVKNLFHLVSTGLPFQDPQALLEFWPGLSAPYHQLASLGQSQRWSLPPVGTCPPVSGTETPHSPKPPAAGSLSKKGRLTNYKISVQTWEVKGIIL